MSASRGRIVASILVVLAFIGLVPTATGAQTAPDGGAGVTVDQSVADAIASGGSADFWVDFAATADLSGADAIADWVARGQYVYDKLTATADASQADLSAGLSKRKVAHQRFWAANTILVTAGDAAALDAARTTTGVSRIRARATYNIPEPTKADAEAVINAVEWGVANINADDVWSTFGVRGEGIVVANIDTGVDFDHPALVNQYRGNLGGGSFDHNYNWWDPSNICAGNDPCDNNNHGTHTMGTMAGDDGGANQIGVAPEVMWIAAKGCESSNCSDAALLSSGQWILAPTNLAGGSPDVSKRPHIVNNSWGGDNGGAVDGWYRSTLTAWTAAGIFGTFSNGNAGSSCNTTGSPADNIEAYGVGAYDINNTIASFSSRGPGEGGAIRPSIAAPGVNVRSSINNGGYGNFNGTSMAAPHLSGAVALMWSAAPGLIGDIDESRSILDDTAIDTANAQCGGTTDDNNVFGEGRLDALAAVNASPVGDTGAIAGLVKNKVTSAPIAGATVSTMVNGSPRTTTTAGDGTYTLPNLPVDTYNVTASAFGYKSRTSSANVTSGNTTTKNFPLTPSPAFPVSGTVKSGTTPLAGATVAIAGTPLSTTTDGAGHYSFASVPAGTYTFDVSQGACTVPLSISKKVNGPEVFKFKLVRVTDIYGHQCSLETSAWIAGTTPVALSGDDVSTPVSLPFPVSFYGTNYATANVSSNGHLSFTAASTAYNNVAIPAGAAPNAAAYPEWDDLVIDGSASVHTATVGSAPNRSFVIEWRNIVPYQGTERWSLEVVLFEGGGLKFQYQGINTSRDAGISATVGIENAAGNDALQYSFGQAVLSDATAIRFSMTGGPF